MKLRGLRARLSWHYGGSLAVVLVGFSAAFLWQHWMGLQDQLDHHLEEDLIVAVQMVDLSSGSAVWRGPAAGDAGYNAGDLRWVEVWSEAGDALFIRGTEEHHRYQAALPKPGRQEGFSSARVEGLPSLRLFVSRQLIDGRATVVRVGRTEAELRDELARWLAASAVAIPVAVLLALAGGYILAGRALAPLGRMIEQARTIGAEQLSARLPITEPRDELGELAAVFNATLARLEDAFGRLRRFTADASHELRTPLTAIRAVGEVALREPQTPAAYRDVIGSMLEESNRLTRLVDSLLTLSRWESGRVPFNRERFDLADVVRDVVGHLSVLAEERQLSLVVTAPQVAHVIADRLMIRQAVINIVDNAIKFSPPGARIVVTVNVDGRSCVLQVSDEGPGIPKVHQERVFDRFYRVDASRGREGGGTGLGLAIAHWAVTANGGAISVRSDEGEGSCFTIRLPAEDSAPD